MRKPLRHAVTVLTRAGLPIDRIRQAGRHTEVRLRNGELVRVHRGNKVSKAFERGLRSSVRRLQQKD
jgi:hypothetical protein